MGVYQKKKDNKVIKTKDGRSWYFKLKYKDVYGKIKYYTSQFYLHKADALDAESKFKLNLHLIDNNNSNKTLDELFNEYIDKIKLDGTLKKTSIMKKEFYYNNHIKEIFGTLTIKNIKTIHYETLKKDLIKKELSNHYINKILGIIDQVNLYSRKYYGVYSDIPDICGKLKVNTKEMKEMMFFTYEEYKQFDSIIDNHFWHTFFELLYFMGLRKGEATALSWDDIDFEKKEVSITKSLTTKIKGEKWTITTPKTKNSIRILPLTDDLIKDLKILKKEYQQYDNFDENWFIFGGIRPTPETTIEVTKNKYCKEANLKQIRIHDFRHSCASLLINKGASIALVSKYLGHSNISITLNTYTHLYESELKAMTNILNKL